MQKNLIKDIEETSRIISNKIRNENGKKISFARWEGNRVINISGLSTVDYKSFLDKLNINTFNDGFGMTQVNPQKMGSQWHINGEILHDVGSTSFTDYINNIGISTGISKLNEKSCKKQDYTVFECIPNNGNTCDGYGGPGCFKALIKVQRITMAQKLIVSSTKRKANAKPVSEKTWEKACFIQDSLWLSCGDDGGHVLRIYKDINADIEVEHAKTCTFGTWPGILVTNQNNVYPTLTLIKEFIPQYRAQLFSKNIGGIPPTISLTRFKNINNKKKTQKSLSFTKNTFGFGGRRGSPSRMDDEKMRDISNQYNKKIASLEQRLMEKNKLVADLYQYINQLESSNMKPMVPINPLILPTGGYGPSASGESVHAPNLMMIPPNPMVSPTHNIPNSPSTSMDVSSSNDLEYYVPTMNNNDNNNNNLSTPMDYVNHPSNNNATSVTQTNVNMMNNMEDEIIMNNNVFDDAFEDGFGDAFGDTFGDAFGSYPYPEWDLGSTYEDPFH